MRPDPRQFLIHVLSQILPTTNFLRQTNNQWQIATEIADLKDLNQRTYASSGELIDAVASFYVEQGMSRGLLPRPVNEETEAGAHAHRAGSQRQAS